MKQARLALGFGIGFYAAWFLTSVTPTPLLWYLPLAHRFELAITVTELGMDLYGRLLVALVAGLVSAAPVQWLARRNLTTLTAWLLVCLGLCASLELIVLARRNPTPLQAPR